VAGQDSALWQNSCLIVVVVLVIYVVNVRLRLLLLLLFALLTLLRSLLLGIGFLVSARCRGALDL